MPTPWEMKKRRIINAVDLVRRFIFLWPHKAYIFQDRDLLLPKPLLQIVFLFLDVLVELILLIERGILTIGLRKQNIYISVDIISADMQLLLRKRSYSVQRSPTLATTLMVEEALQKSGKVVSIAELKRKLPKQVMHQSLVAILDYLEYSGKIAYQNGRILWTFNPDSVLMRRRGLRVR